MAPVLIHISTGTKTLKMALLDRSVVFPEDKPLPGDDRGMPYFPKEDNAFALGSYLMKSFTSKRLPNDQRIFNYRLPHAKRVVESSSAIMANRTDMDDLQ